ncbi:MAG: hypothetical protein HUJ95_06480 [Bacteroidales bacterium]|nr:hypothetical protein [Bacteroidales bacterium]
MKTTLTTALSSLAAIAAMTISCNKDYTYSPESPSVSTEDEPKTKVELQIDNSSLRENVTSTQVFVYDTGGTLLSYGTSSEGVVESITVPCTECKFHIIANCGTLPLASVQTESALQACKILLSETNGNQPLFGSTVKNIVDSDPVEVQLQHYNSKISIKNVKKNFTNETDSRTFTLKQIYIASAAKDCLQTGAQDATSAKLFTENSTGGNDKERAFLVKDFTQVLAQNSPVAIDADLYTLPAADSKVIFVCQIGEADYYYCVPLPADLRANQWIELLNVNFTKQGAVTPGGTIPGDVSLTFELTVKDWEKDASSQTVDF